MRLKDRLQISRLSPKLDKKLFVGQPTKEFVQRDEVDLLVNISFIFR